MYESGGQPVTRTGRNHLLSSISHPIYGIFHSQNRLRLLSLCKTVASVYMCVCVCMCGREGVEGSGSGAVGEPEGQVERDLTLLALCSHKVSSEASGEKVIQTVVPQMARSIFSEMQRPCCLRDTFLMCQRF